MEYQTKKKNEYKICDFIYRHQMKKRIQTFININNQLSSEKNYHTFMKDTRIKKLVCKIINKDKKCVHYFLTGFLLHKFPKKYLQGIIGIKMFMILETLYQKMMLYIEYPNMFNLNSFIYIVNVYVEFFEIWREEDKQLHIEQIAHFIFEQRRQKLIAKDDAIIQCIDELIEKRFKELEILSTDYAKTVEWVNSYEPRLFNEQLEKDVERTFHKAFEDLLIDAIHNHQYDIVYNTLVDFIHRLKKLTPNNKTQQTKVETMFDLDYLKNILENNAFDKNVFMEYIRKFKSIFEEYHASVDIQDSRKLFDNFIHNNADNENIATTLCEFFKLCDKEITTIEKRLIEFYSLIDKE